MTAPAAGTRPALHFTPRRGWINDPYGLTWRDGRYHLFFQHVPDRSQWAPEQSWGHATSNDLLTWTEEPVALAPGEGDDGVWSGSVVTPATGSPVLFYTSVRSDDPSVGRIRTAEPRDAAWAGWRKSGPVVEPPDDLDLTAFRDPYVLHDGRSWLMVVGAGLADGTACALAYRSDDLSAWRYDGVLASRHRTDRTPVWTGDGWECPQLFQVKDRWVLTVSVWEPEQGHYEAYAVGDLVDGRLVAQSWGRLTYGPSYYAGSAFTDAHGRPCLIHWLRGVSDPAGLWAGAHSLPHLLVLEGDSLVARPHPQLDAARADGGLTTSGRLEGSVPVAADLEWLLDPARGSAVALTCQGRPAVTLVCGSGRLVATTASGTWRMPCTAGSVRVVRDGPTLEIFGPEGVMALVVPDAVGTWTSRVDRGTLEHHALVVERDSDNGRRG